FEETLWSGQALGRDIAGSAEVISKVSRKDILSYRDKFYTASNTIIAVSGQFDLRKLEDLVDETWSKLPNKKAPGYKAIERKKDGPKLSMISKPTEQAYLVLGFEGYHYRNKNNPALRILSATLGGGMSSRLFLRIREKLGLAYYVNTSFN